MIRQARKAGDLDARSGRGRTANSPVRKKKGQWHWHSFRAGANRLKPCAVWRFHSTPPWINLNRGFRRQRRKRQALAERLSKENESIRECQARLQSLTLQQDVPTEEAVAAARGHREEGWRLIKAAWLESAPADEDHAAFLAAFAPGGSLAAAYEESVQRADALADRLRREADRVAHKADARGRTRKASGQSGGTRTRAPGARGSSGRHRA